MIVRLVAIFLAAAGLSACFSSKEPLIGPDQAVFPYQKIVYRGESGDETQTLFRSGDAYGVESLDSPMRIRFLPAGDDFYVAQAVGTKDDETAILYAFLKVDLAAMTAESYAALAPDAGVDQPGFTDCGDHGVCVDNVETYIAYAKSRVASGDPPDVTYTIISTE